MAVDDANPEPMKYCDEFLRRLKVMGKSCEEMKAIDKKGGNPPY